MNKVLYILQRNCILAFCYTAIHFVVTFKGHYALGSFISEWLLAAPEEDEPVSADVYIIPSDDGVVCN